MNNGDYFETKLKNNKNAAQFLTLVSVFSDTTRLLLLHILANYCHGLASIAGQPNKKLLPFEIGNQWVFINVLPANIYFSGEVV